MNTFSFGKLVIFGVGLIGGSLARALRARGAVQRVIGVGRHAASIARALELGVIDEAVLLDNSTAGGAVGNTSGNAADSAANIAADSVADSAAGNAANNAVSSAAGNAVGNAANSTANITADNAVGSTANIAADNAVGSTANIAAGNAVGSTANNAANRTAGEAALAAALAGADIVLLAAPVAQTRALFERIAPWLEATTIVTDAGSTKGDVVEAARAVLGARVAQFVPGHPIAGRESSGVEAALADLYVGRNTVLCPLPENPPGAVARIAALWRAAGAQVSEMPLAQHDRVFAAVSHLPHVLSFALVGQILASPDAALKFSFAAGGFRDFTRIAASSPEMWRDVCVANRAALLAELDAYEAVLAHLRAAIDAGDGAALEAAFSHARQARLGWRAHGDQTAAVEATGASGQDAPETALSLVTAMGGLKDDAG